ncbi:MAG: sensor domain-containing diguanylate cyclase [Actinomycetota bacterium]|nr:sensor domain-containing diguanylate cyclase [Actinomycetota bacterium]
MGEIQDSKFAIALRKFNELLNNYFPSSRTSSTDVKLTACLSELVNLLKASGAAIFVLSPDEKSLIPISIIGAEMSDKLAIPLSETSIVTSTFLNGKSKIATNLEQEELFFSTAATPKSCLSTFFGTKKNMGMLFLWSCEPTIFEIDDLEICKLFTSYVAVLEEVDMLSSKLIESVAVDPLSGLFNLRQFEQKLHLETSRAKRYGLVFSLIVTEIDNYVEYNRKCGSLLGNLALSDVASIFLKEIREFDFAARIGEYRFSVILPETGRLGALSLARRLGEKVGSYPFPAPEDHKSIPISLSTGISSYPSGANNEEELVENAVQALESAKREGPGTIKIWEA